MFQRKKKKYRLLADDELISVYKHAQEKDAFAVIYERYGHLVMGVCLKYLKDETEAEDLTSSIFETLGQKICKHNINYFKGWLHRLVKNECLMVLRKSKTHFLHISQLEVLSEEKTDPQSLENQLVAVEESLKQLKTDQATCLRLFYLDNKSYQEVAALTNLDLKQVKSAIQNGKRNLKLILIQHDEFNEYA
jgi:RNA polymerase sigma-70 factor (ECF subfamily)